MKSLPGASARPRPVRVTAHLIALIAALAITAAPRVALAHAHLVRSAPAANSHVSGSPTELRLWFSEAAEVTMTTISVTGPNGERVAIGPIDVDGTDPLVLYTALAAPIGAGTYTVRWRTVATDDGHPSSGKFSFVVDAATNGALTGTDAAASISPGHRFAETAPAPTIAPQGGAVSAMDVEAPSYVIARWLNFMALITVIGVVAFRFLVVPRVVSRLNADSAVPESSSAAAFAIDSARRGASIGLTASILVVVAAVWRLYAERAVIGGGIDIRTVLHSYWGLVWHVQLGAALLACVAFPLARHSVPSKAATSGWALAAIAAVILGASSAFAGHAMAAPEYRTTSVALDILHVLAAGGWLGGLFALATVGVPVALSAGRYSDRPAGMPFVARVVNAFSPVALSLAGTVVVTGGLAAKMRIGSWAALLDSTYGKVLMLKLGFVLLVVAGGAYNWRRMRIALSLPSGDSAVSRFRRSAWFEITAGILVIAVTAVLVATQPPIH